MSDARRVDDDAAFMQRALELGARGTTSPNPHVGAVVVQSGRIVGEGFHERAGTPHAEVHALRAAGEAARGATLYCTLEPCNHHGRTPPCTEAILAAGIARVVIGCEDPKVHGAGAGAERLRAAGVEVVVGVERDAAEALVADFATVALAGRPLVTLKGAVTLDGRIASRTGDSKWITGEAARAEAHALRATHDAVLVGVGTVLADDPGLDVRLAPPRPNAPPVRVVLDTTLRTPLHVKLVASARVIPTWIVHGPSFDPARAQALDAAGVVRIEVETDNGRVGITPALAALAARGISSVLVEGGGKVHGALLDEGVVDRVAVFVAPVILGDAAGLPLVDRAAPPSRLVDALRLVEPRVRVLGVDVLVEGRTRAGWWPRSLPERSDGG